MSRRRNALIAQLAIAVAAVSVLSAAASPLPTGAWSNVRVSKGEDPHASGIEVEIREHNGTLVGFLSEYVGPVADPPVGKLESIRFDEKTGFITFTSKLSVGVVPAAAGNTWVPSKNVYDFKGAIGKTGLTGTLRRKSVQEDGTGLAYEENIQLKTRTATDADQVSSESFEDWIKRWTELLKTRGPKW